MPIFTVIFLLALVCTVSIRVWLATRHIRYVHTHRNRVPENFSSQVNLDAHQKAADYTCAKTRLNYANICLDTALLLMLTLGGGLNALNFFWSNWFSDPLLQGMIFILRKCPTALTDGAQFSLCSAYALRKDLMLTNKAKTTPASVNVSVCDTRSPLNNAVMVSNIFTF